MSRPSVHISEIKSFLRCRLAWFWAATPPRGLGLEPMRGTPALQFGTMVHEALQIGYETDVKFVDAFQHVATVEKERLRELEGFHDEAEEEYNDRWMQGMKMMKGYQDWCVEADKGTKFLELERKWKGVKVGRIPMEGRFDALVERDDGLWIMDFKTSSNRATAWTTQDLQATTYIMAARQLFGEKIRGAIFRFLLKKAPYDYEQLILKSGKMTKRSNLPNLTTYEDYATALAVAVLLEMGKKSRNVGSNMREALETKQGCAEVLTYDDFKEYPWYPEFHEKFVLAQKLHFETLQELKGGSNFFWDQKEYRTEQQINLAVKFVLLPAAKEIVSKRKGRWVGPTGLGAAFTICSSCKFKAPCELLLRGADYKTVLRTEYQRREFEPKVVVDEDTG